MTLNLERKNNYYLTEIDKTQDDLNITKQIVNNTTNDLNITTNDLNITKEIVNNTTNDLDKNFKFNYNTNSSSHFNDDVIFYLDFSDETNIGKDVSGFNRHGKNINRVPHSTNETHSAFFDIIPHASTAHPYSNVRCIDMSSHLTEILNPTYTLSFTICPLSNTRNIFGFTDNASADIDSYFSTSILSNGIFRVIYKYQNVLTLDARFTISNYNTFTHIVIMASSTGHLFYVNGLPATNLTYTIGDTTHPLDITVFNSTTDSFIIGALQASKTYNFNTVGYRHPFNGYIGSFMLHNRLLTELEIDMFSKNIYGYDVVILTGQSNMAGNGVGEINIDDDYTLQDDRCKQFNTRYAVTLEAPHSTIIPLVPFEDAIGRLAFPEVNDDTKRGPWKTFADDYIRYSGMPYKKQLLLVPTAMSGSSFIHHWLPTKPGFGITVSAVNQIMDPQLHPSQSIKITALLFNLGESDIVLYNVNYKTHFYEMYNGFLSQMNGFNSQIPVVLTQISGEYEPYINGSFTPNIQMKSFINEKLFELATENEMFDIVLTGGLNYIADFKHIDITGQRILGSEMFDKYMTLSKQINKKPKYLYNNNVSNINILSDIKLKPKNELELWQNLSLSCYAEKRVTLNCVGAYTGLITLKFVKLGKLCIMSLETDLIFTATNALIVSISSGLTEDLVPQNDNVSNILKSDIDENIVVYLFGNTISFEREVSETFNIGASYTILPFALIYTTKVD